MAGLLLKVGLFGVIKVRVSTNLRFFWVQLLSFTGYILAPVLSILSRETKHIVAYSSVAHINLLLNGLSFCCLGLNTRSYLVSLSHGYISSAIFFMVGEISHRRGSRMVYYSSGLYGVSGFITLVCCIVMLANAGVPPHLSFWGELIVVGSLTRVEILFLFSVLIYFMLGFYYSIFLIMRMGRNIGVKSYNTYSSVVATSRLLPLLLVVVFIV